MSSPAASSRWCCGTRSISATPRCRCCARSPTATLQPGAKSVKAGRLGELQVVNGSEILLGSPFVFSKDNVGQFDF